MKSLHLFFGLLTPVRTKPAMVIVAILVASLFGLEGAAKGQETLDTVIPDFVVTCIGPGQLCEPPFVTTVETRTLLQVQYTVRSTHCASVRLHIFVDDLLVRTTDFLGWPGGGTSGDLLPLGTGLLDLGPVSPGTHTLALQAEGQVGGCNTGNVGSWGGSLRVVTAPFLTAVASSDAPVPGGTGVFTAFPQSPAVGTTRAAFLGLGSAGEAGVYLSAIPPTPTAPPNPVKVADLLTAIPGGTGTFTSFSDLALAVEVLVPQPPPIHTAFIGSGVDQQGVYLSDVTDVASPTPPPIKVADLTTAIPGGTGNFTGFTQLAASGTRTSFIGTGSGQEGVYSCDSAAPVDPCQPIADLTTLIAGGTGTFTGFTQLAASGTRTSFIGTGSGQEGVYSCDSAAPTDPCQSIADLFTPIPGGTGNFTGFSAVSTSLGHTAFLGHGNDDQVGIYLASTLKKMIAVGDILEGKVVTELRLGRNGLDGNRLSFAATFDDGSQGVFVYTVPPSAADPCTITTVLDNFNRADGSVGTNWRGATGTSFYRIAGNRLDVQIGGPIYWNPTAFGTNQAAAVTLSTVDTKSPSQGVLLKVQGGSVPNAGAISVVYDAAAKAVRVSTLRLGTLSWTPYGNTSVLFANGDKLGACAKANGEVRVYKNDTLVKTVTLNAADQRFFNAKGGKVGIWSLLAPQAFLDDFGGATIVP